ncbi:MAG: polyprenyl synthetase family protein [Clostridiales bacterium]|jgi:heptaprenyl diphosphate synthase|nr:polyprenyl synthetase family protein [Clostridiales bacterium]
MTEMVNNKLMPDAPFETIDYEQALTMTENEIERCLKNAPRIIRRQTGYLARTEGKYIRARAMLTVSMDNECAIRADAAKAAAAIELLHLATLVHDDIIDNAEKRRGMTSLHKKFGAKAAVLCGDYLFCLAFELASSISSQDERRDLESIKNLLPRYLTEILMGELRQNSNIRNFNLSEREYFRIISGKTAALFEASFLAGFLFSGEAEEQKDKYLKIGNNIGLIFQLADDCADYEATKKTANKPVLSDFRQGVVTLPLIYALGAEMSLKERINEIDARELKAAVKAAGGLEYTHSKIATYRSKTKKLIDSLNTIPEKKTRLAVLLDRAAGISES